MEIFDIKEINQDVYDAYGLIYQQWGNFFRKSKEEKIARLEKALSEKQVFPKMYVLKEDNEVVGTFVFDQMDVDGKQVPSLWYVLIREDLRGKGLGREILNFIDQKAEENFDILYLVTEHTGYYEKIGFEFIKMVDHNGIMDRFYFKKYR